MKVLIINYILVLGCVSALFNQKDFGGELKFTEDAVDNANVFSNENLAFFDSNFFRSVFSMFKLFENMRFQENVFSDVLEPLDNVKDVRMILVKFWNAVLFRFQDSETKRFCLHVINEIVNMLQLILQENLKRDLKEGYPQDQTRDTAKTKENKLINNGLKQNNSALMWNDNPETQGLIDICNSYKIEGSNTIVKCIETNQLSNLNKDLCKEYMFEHCSYCLCYVKKEQTVIDQMFNLERSSEIDINNTQIGNKVKRSITLIKRVPRSPTESDQKPKTKRSTQPKKRMNRVTKKKPIPKEESPPDEEDDESADGKKPADEDDEENDTPKKSKKKPKNVKVNRANKKKTHFKEESSPDDETDGDDGGGGGGGKVKKTTDDDEENEKENVKENDEETVKPKPDRSAKKNRRVNKVSEEGRPGTFEVKIDMK